MAIVFVSPREQENKFLKIILIALTVLAVVVVLLYLFLKFKNEIQGISSNATPGNANISIDFTVLDSPEVKNLEPFNDVTKEFSYTGTNKAGKIVKGSVFAKDQDTAQADLTSQGITTTNLQEATVGRNEPFTAYYPIKK
jgi:uncharacterized protein YpmB